MLLYNAVTVISLNSRKARDTVDETDQAYKRITWRTYAKYEARY